jgi:hypothetical protein
MALLMKRALRRLGPLALLLALIVAPGCGARFELPTESRARVIPGDGSYQMVATWTGMTGIRDVLLTQGSGTQLFLLFNTGGADLSSRGDVRSYARKLATGVPAPIPGISFATLFNPIELAAGSSGGAGSGRIFVLDAGDTCLARTDPAAPTTCDPSYTANGRRVTNFSATWRVREFGLVGGDTISTFTDTTLASVTGIAADDRGNVYVAGTAIIYVLDPNDARLRTRLYQYRIYRYARGPRYPGSGNVPGDPNMPGSGDPAKPGSGWHRDSTYVVEEGSGLGTLVDPRGLSWSSATGPALYAADFGKNWVQKLNDQAKSTGFYFLDGGLSGTPFNGPTDVVVDLDGFLYICDNGNRRVLRYGGGQTYEQIVNVESDSDGQTLLDPVAVAADDSLVYVADRGLNKVIRYQRRK